jgi:hypothetical protein
MGGSGFQSLSVPEHGCQRAPIRGLTVADGLKNLKFQMYTKSSGSHSISLAFFLCEET